MSKFTKQRIMDAFLSLLNKKSLDKLTVKDIIEKAEVNRNTFYYYFEDIYDLLHAVFKQKFDDYCNKAREKSSFYDEYVRAAEFILNNKRAMEHIYHSKDKELIQQYMEKVTWIFIEYFVIEAADSYKLSDEGIHYLTGFYTDAIVGNTMRWIKEGMPPFREKYLLLVSKSFENSIDDMIQSYLKYS